MIRKTNMFVFLFLVSTYIKNDNFGAIQKKQFTTVRQDGERRYLLTILTESGSPPGRQKVVRGSKVPVLTSHAGLNPRSKHASLSLTASLAALQAGYIYSGNESSFAGELSFLIWYRADTASGEVSCVLWCRIRQDRGGIKVGRCFPARR